MIDDPMNCRIQSIESIIVYTILDIWSLIIEDSNIDIDSDIDNIYGFRRRQHVDSDTDYLYNFKEGNIDMVRF